MLTLQIGEGRVVVFCSSYTRLFWNVLYETFPLLQRLNFTTLLFNLWNCFLQCGNECFHLWRKIAPHKMFAKYSSSLEIVLEIVPVSGFLLPRQNTPQVRKKGQWSHRLKTCWNDHSSPVWVTHWAILYADRGNRRKSPSVHGAAMAIFAGRRDRRIN